MTNNTAPPLTIADVKLPRDPDAYVRDHQKAIRDTLEDAAVFHHDQHIPRHFERYAPAKYGYRKRGAKYQKIKDRMGLPPLVSPNPKTTGDLKDEVTTKFRVTKTQFKSTLHMRLPFKGGTGRLRLKPWQTQLSTPQENILHRIAELSVIADDERKRIAGFIETRYGERIKLPGVRRRMRVGRA